MNLGPDFGCRLMPQNLTSSRWCSAHHDPSCWPTCTAAYCSHGGVRSTRLDATRLITPLVGDRDAADSAALRRLRVGGTSGSGVVTAFKDDALVVGARRTR